MPQRLTRRDLACAAVFQTMPAGDCSFAVLADLVQQYATPGDQCRALARVVRTSAAAQGTPRRRGEFVAHVSRAMVDTETRLAAALSLVQEALNGEDLQELLTRAVVLLAPVGVTTVMDGNLQPPPPLPRSTPAAPPIAARNTSGDDATASETQGASGDGADVGAASGSEADAGGDGGEDMTSGTAASVAREETGDANAGGDSDPTGASVNGDDTAPEPNAATASGDGDGANPAGDAAVDPAERAEEAAVELAELRQRHEDAGKGA